ncbi:MAG: signal peptidase II [Anaerolineae bacterium]
MKRTINLRGLIILLIAAVVIGLDQYTKHWVRQNIPLNESWNPISWLEPIVTLTHVQNTGAAFGLFPNLGAGLVVVAVLVVGAIIVFYRQLSSGAWLLRIALGLQLGGAIGNNLIDRLVFGYVTDFVNFRIWPVWNVADASIVVGTILLAYYALFMDTALDKKHEDVTHHETESAC